MADPEDNPVTNGLIALVAVAVVVGLLAGLAALLGTRMMGLGDQTVGGSEPGGGAATLYLPDPVPTESHSAPLVTLIPIPDETFTPDESASAATGTTESPGATDTATVDKKISLSAGTTTVGKGETLLLTGTYPTGEGTVLDIWYNVEGSWEEFPLDVNVSGGIFQTYVSTFKSGSIQWRVEDQSRQVVSNTVTVQHG